MFARLVASVLVVGGVGAAGCGEAETVEEVASEGAGESARAPVAVRTVQVGVGTVRETSEAVGTLRSRKVVRVTADVPGTVAAMAYREGDSVGQGQVVARLETPELEAKHQRVQAELRRGKTRRDYRCEVFETDRELQESGALSGARLDRSRQACRSAREAVKSARASLREVEIRLEDRVVRSPVDGVVLERKAEPGETVGPGRPLAVIGSRSREVVVPVVDSQLAKGIAVGTPVEMSLMGAGTLEGRVARIGRRARGPGRAVDVFVEVPAGEGGPSAWRERPDGTSVEVAFVLDERKDTALVPREALLSSGRQAAVFVAEPVEGAAGSSGAIRKVRRVGVEVGIAEGGRVAVGDAVEAGSRVVITNLDELADGNSVFAVEIDGGPFGSTAQKDTGGQQ